MKLYILIFFFISYNCLAQDTRNENACQKVIDSLTNNEVYKTVDEMPRIEGGMQQLYKQMVKQVRIPADIPISDTKVIVAFIVEKNGQITGKRVIRNITGTDIGQELLNLVSQYKWKAGKCNKKPVAVLQTLPMYIRIK